MSASGTVHPHVRGDGVDTSDRDTRSFGSPPRAWGRPTAIPLPRRSRRFTPTCVGTACRWSSSWSTPPVHPHVRGDGEEVFNWHRWRTGSPPRAWGRRSAFYQQTRNDRFTPTCVGTARPSACRCNRTSVHPHVRGDGTGNWPTFQLDLYLFLGLLHELNALEVSYRPPRRAPESQLEALLVVSAMYHDPTTLPHRLASSRPQTLPHHRRDSTHEDSRLQFQEPLGQFTAKALGYSFQHYDYQWFPPTDLSS